MALDDLEKIRAAPESDALPKDKDADALITAWYKDLEENKNLSSCLNAEQAAEIYCYYGNLLVSKNDFAGAAKSFQKAAALSPNKADLHILITDALFLQGDYTQGIAHLNRAIELDLSCAEHWEKIGDNMWQAGKINDAVSAYTQCFIHLPENIALLKKIGDCYMAMGQLETARESYAQLKHKLEKYMDSEDR